MYHSAAAARYFLHQPGILLIDSMVLGILRNITLVKCNKERYTLLLKQFNKLPVYCPESLCSIYYKNCYVGFFKYLTGPLHTELSQASLVVKSRSIDYHYRSEREYLH